jgi:GNAT superfamily N-acetyltransferase
MHGFELEARSGDIPVDYNLLGVKRIERTHHKKTSLPRRGRRCMDSIRFIALADRRRLAPLFTDHRHLRPDVDAVLQGYCGTAIANSGSDLQVAQLALSGLTFFGGDPTHSMARHLVEQVSGETIILVASAAWRALVCHVHGPRLLRQPRVAFSATCLELAHLRQLMAGVPAGYRIRRIDLDLAQRVGGEVSAGLILPEVWASLTDFVARGIGFCALMDERMVCAATSAARCDDAIEIQINTTPSCRRLGLATAVGATLVAHCLEHGLEPDWDTDADNLPSQRLAQRLGYVPAQRYEWLVLPE